MLFRVTNYIICCITMILNRLMKISTVFSVSALVIVYLLGLNQIFTLGPCWLCFKYGSLYVSVMNSQSIPTPHPSLLVTITSFSKSKIVSFSFFFFLPFRISYNWCVWLIFDMGKKVNAFVVYLIGNFFFAVWN